MNETLTFLNQTWTPIACAQCGEDVHPETHEFNEGLCSRCHTWIRYKQDRSGNAKTTLQTRQDNWLKICPVKYRENSTELIDIGSFRSVMDWKMNPNGILCLGDSQRGKTTTCWRLLEKLYVLNGVEIEAMSEPEFSQMAASKHRAHEIDKWLYRLCNIQVLFLDDLGHSATTARHLEELYHVVEKRTAWKKPIIATSQFSRDEFTEKAGRGGEKTVIAILNRLKSSCTVINF